MFGNAMGRGFPVANTLVFSYVCGAIVLALAVIALIVAWKRGLFFRYALPWACLLLFTFLTAAFVCVGGFGAETINRSLLGIRPSARYALLP